jgi:hypothetical protein
LIKGAIYAVETVENPENDKAKEARQNWTLAEAQGAEVGDLYDFLDDDYDLLKDLN